MREVFDVPTASWYISGLYSAGYLGADINGADTIINGKEYLLFHDRRGSFLLWEDTINSKVFLRANSGIPPDYLLYDFSVSKGDTVLIDVPGQWYYLYHIIDTVYHIYIPTGDSVKSFGISVFSRNDTLSAPFSFYNYTTWYEGIGSQEDLLQPMFGEFLGSSIITNLYCYRDSVQGVQLEPFVVFNVDSNINCDFNPPISISTYSDKRTAISLYPNPFNDVLQLEMLEGSAGGIYEIYDSSGKCLLKGVLRSHHNTINTGALSPGIYFFKLQTDHSIFTRKLIKS